MVGNLFPSEVLTFLTVPEHYTGVHQLPCLRGYGEPKLVDFDQDRKIIRLRLTNSPLARQFSGYGKPVDALVAGAIAAGTRLTLAGKIVCRETLCEAKGDDYCEFEVTTIE